MVMVGLAASRRPGGLEKIACVAFHKQAEGRSIGGLQQCLMFK